MTRLLSRILGYCTHRLRKVNLVLVLLICIIFTTIMRINMENLMSRQQTDSSLPQKLLHVTLPFVVVHIDLKGAPPRLDYLLSLLKLLKKFGVNGLLIEYEDMFPYEGRLERLRAMNYYEKEQLQTFLTTAADSGFIIIPLIQTFGHMEFVLKLKEFQQLCEVPFICDVICPSHGETAPLIEDILKQIIQFHKSIIPLKYIHIGFNEVTDINKCPVCIERELPQSLVFLGHLKKVTDFVKKLDNDTKVLIWDDMIRPIDDNKCKYIDIDKDLEPIYSDYQNKLTISHSGLDTYRQRFGNIWIASAFKGVDGRTATFPNLKERFENHLSWMNQILDYTFDDEDEVSIFKGIILTGRSRYNHFAPPCELLPTSIPSLLINLLLIQRFKEGIPYKTNNWPEFYYKYLKSKIDEVFECNVCLEKNDFSNCLFEAKKLYTTIKHAEYKRKQFLANYLYEYPWILTHDQYLKYNRINKRLTMNLVNKYVKFGKQLLTMEDKLKKIMIVYFNDTVVQEYVGYTYYNIKKKVTKAFSTFCILLNTFYKNMRPITEIDADKYLLELRNLNNTVCLTYNGPNNVSLSSYKNDLANYYRS